MNRIRNQSRCPLCKARAFRLLIDFATEAVFYQCAACEIYWPTESQREGR
jgi:hypothetical protein